MKTLNQQFRELTHVMSNCQKSNKYKKTYTIIILCVCSFFVCSNIYGQTYAYKYLYSIKDNGERFDPYGYSKIQYVTFSSDRYKVYTTDKDGKIEVGQNAYTYVGVKDGKYVCQYNGRMSSGTPYTRAYLFSNNYNTMEFYWSADDLIPYACMDVHTRMEK